MQTDDGFLEVEESKMYTAMGALAGPNTGVHDVSVDNASCSNGGNFYESN